VVRECSRRRFFVPATLCLADEEIASAASLPLIDARTGRPANEWCFSWFRHHIAEVIG